MISAPVVQLLLANLTGQLHDFLEDREGYEQRCGINCKHSDENWRLRWWYYHWLLVSMGRPQARDVRRCAH